MIRHTGGKIVLPKMSALARTSCTGTAQTMPLRTLKAQQLMEPTLKLRKPRLQPLATVEHRRGQALHPAVGVDQACPSVFAVLPPNDQQR
mmetsp:Transcript_68220/g.149916  ORF Transcript_68220/g.149916 Transcript_68220/m.149916 type:complete len:90 (+) Transcript_68220:686-955(+)